MLKHSHQRNIADSNLPIIKRSKLKFRAFWLWGSMEPCTQKVVSSFLLQTDRCEDIVSMEAQILE